MNFEYTEEQQLLKESIVKWAQDNYSFDQRRVTADSDDGFSRENWATFAELGWLSVPFAEEHGGFGGDIVDMAAIMQEFGRILTLEPVVSTLVMFGGMLRASTNTQLQADIIPSVIDGSTMGAVALYEPQARFDVSNMLTSASRDGDNYVVNGNKCMVLGGANADQFIVAARTSGGQTDEAGISLFLIDKGTEGLSVDTYTMMDGHKVADLMLDNVTVSKSNRLCDEGDAYQLIEQVVADAHVALAAEAVGIMEKLNLTTVEYTKTRKQFGVPISSFQVLQHRMVDTFMAAEQSKSLLVGTLCELSEVSTAPERRAKMVLALRALIAKNGKHIGDEAIQMHGGMGMTDELDVGHYVKRLMMINLLFGNGDFFQDQFNQLAYG